MVIRAGRPVAAGLHQVAQLDRQERARIARQLCQQYPPFRALQKQVAMARVLAFGSGLALAAAIMLLVRDASVWFVSALVFGGFAGFGYVAVVLTDSRFDLLLAVLGAHRTDELHARVVTSQIYGDEPEWDEPPEPVRRTPEVRSAVYADRQSGGDLGS